MRKKAFSLIELSVVLLIIGILVAGITNSNRLVRASRLEAARALTVSSPVASIEGLVFWVEATQIQSFNAGTKEPTDSTEVASWNDISPQSTTKHNFVQVNSTRYPLYIRDGFDNLPAVRFDGVNDYLQINSLSSTEFFPENNNTIFVVLRPTQASLNNAKLIFSFQTSSSNRYGFEFSQGDNILRYDCVNDVAGRLVTTQSIFNQKSILTLRKRHNTQSLRINGEIVASQTNSLSLSPFTRRFVMGSYQDNYELPFSGEFAEFIVFNSGLTVADIQAVESYLSKKWKISLSQ